GGRGGLRGGGVVCGEVHQCGAGKTRRAQLDRLDRILAAVTGERAADEYDRGESVDQTELAQRVGDIDVRVCPRQFPARAQRRLETGGGRGFEDGRAAGGVARRDDREPL